MIVMRSFLKKAVGAAAEHPRLLFVAALAIIAAVAITIAPAEQVIALAYGNFAGAPLLLIHLLLGVVTAGIIAGLLERIPPSTTVAAVAWHLQISLALRASAVKATIRLLGRKVLAAAPSVSATPLPIGAPSAVLGYATSRLHPHIGHSWSHGTSPTLVYEQAP